MRVIPSVVQSRRSVSAYTHTAQLPLSTLGAVQDPDQPESSHTQ